MTDCGICCEKLNNSTRKEVNCVYCNYVVCRTCFQKYITETMLDPHCMSCKKDFNHEFIVTNCTNVFVTKTLKAHRENVLLQREKALLPETQPYVEIEHQRRDLFKAATNLEEKRIQLMRQVRLIDRDIQDLQIQAQNLTLDTQPVEERKKFIRKCPLENCRGFLSTHWKCGSCEKKICNKCNEENGNNHECIPENVASMELLNKDSKPCPNCGILIFRISGCSMMFCTDCKTPWDWGTQCIVTTGNIHNPHYYDFVQRGGGVINRNNGDIPCGGLPDLNELRNCLARKVNSVDFLFKIHRCITHIQYHEMPRYIVDDMVVTNRRLRIKYLMNELSEEDFKTELQQNERKRRKTIAFRTIYEMFVNVASDVFRQIVIHCKKRQKVLEFHAGLKQHTTVLENLIEYFNENLKDIGKVYKCVYPGIARNNEFVSNLETANYRLMQQT